MRNKPVGSAAASFVCIAQAGAPALAAPHVRHATQERPDVGCVFGRESYKGILLMTNMDPGRNPPRYRRESTNYSGWVLGAIAALVVIVAVAYAMTDRSKIASPVPDTTAGQSSQAPGAPRGGAPATNR
jgi:hypothetical protein